MAVKITLDDATQLPTQFEARFLNPAERLHRALKIWGAFMGAALFSVFIPVLHFVLVPVFTLIAFISGFRRYKEVSFVDLGTMKCPKCQRDLKQKQVFQTSDDPTSKIYCYECRTGMRLEIESHSAK